jgi:hypothetical protein
VVEPLPDKHKGQKQTKNSIRKWAKDMKIHLIPPKKDTQKINKIKIFHIISH